ncbi:TetR/AcrR family transcriptional regulator [Mycobacterium sp. 852014-52144_SCH5372336]|uniref:TetR/AcrR family transcriptional regulator n=1 Tax=Mycobacterium sp. 852014-52144_SCH5372336 TaxID=1834115 RepID=UPI0008020667|nr:TetR/AcrR family transcriptional regulator [Mycobacterium sp. 852014-52144_SCH5372336]OBB75887.1 hypothetical protein A5759_06480 [Mycobacterium sp. 852014-52144_SCH5372336]
MTARRMRGPQRRQQILDVCLDVVTDEGFHAATIDRIARECGITRTVVYEHFGTLAGMLVALIDREAHRASESFLAAVSSTGSTELVSMSDTVAAVLQAIDADSKTWRLFLFPAEGGPPELYQRLHQARGIVASYILARVTASAAHLGVDDVELHARVLHAAADEMVRLHLTDPNEYPIDRLIALINSLDRRVPLPVGRPHTGDPGVPSAAAEATPGRRPDRDSTSVHAPAPGTVA